MAEAGLETLSGIPDRSTVTVETTRMRVGLEEGSWPRVLVIHDGGTGQSTFQATFSTPEEAFEAAIDRLGRVAENLSALALATSIAVAEIEAEGDRIDRLTAENRARLDDLLAGKW
jgi:hypothetical protein